MNQTDNQRYIERLNGDITYYKKNIGNAVNGAGRRSYKNAIKQSETAKELAILKERNISN